MIAKHKIITTAAALVTSIFVAQMAMADSHNPSRKDIVDTAVEAGSFKTLAAALKAAGLVDTLKGDGPFTVLAPTDEAFAKLPKGTVDSLLKPENRDQLVEILTYHVIPGRVAAKQVVKLDNADTVAGKEVSIEFRDSSPLCERFPRDQDRYQDQQWDYSRHRSGVASAQEDGSNEQRQRCERDDFTSHR